MKKKRIVFGIVFLLLVCLCVYFRPMSLSDLIDEKNTILISASQIRIEDGLPYIDAAEALEIGNEQKETLLSLLENHSYQRTFGTLFSDGSMTGTGDHLIYIFIYEGDHLKNSIVLSSDGQCSVNDKTYRMADAAQLIEQIGNAVQNEVEK